MSDAERSVKPIRILDREGKGVLVEIWRYLASTSVFDIRFRLKDAGAIPSEQIDARLKELERLCDTDELKEDVESSLPFSFAAADEDMKWGPFTEERDGEGPMLRRLVGPVGALERTPPPDDF